MRKAFDLLQAVTAAIPPGPNQHHGLTLKDDGPGLVLIVMRGSRYDTCFLDPEDLDREVPDVMADILRLLPPA